MLHRTLRIRSVASQRFILASRMQCFSSKSGSRSSLLEVDQVQQLISESSGKVKFVDGSWYMNKDKKPFDEYLQERVIGAQFFDIDEVSDKSTNLPHMIPTPEVFANNVAKMGISNDDHVVVYTKSGAFSAARVWWTFKLFGHENVSILNGGLGAWKENGGPVENGQVNSPPAANYIPNLNKNLIVNAEQVLRIVNTGSAQILDARSMERYLAKVPEPRPGLPGGHIPGSLCLPFSSILDAKDSTRFRSLQEIKDVVSESGIVLGCNVVFTCGSGVTASVLFFALHLLGINMNKLAVYDGSWTEWAQNPDLPRIDGSNAFIGNSK